MRFTAAKFLIAKLPPFFLGSSVFISRETRQKKVPYISSAVSSL